ncbi:NAD(P)-dependent oxidoreductase [Zwartia vadi]|uniref:NAD(P)-dependent oxidoreductase n=1 Tax=Zwartia vadi TaxID=3058168 RepID=UPI0025B580CF|nr:NAD(P)-dependent oxidoreductase [Zwartia vadi]MDN3987182.1 NAD(P)-dependent oxidoreductase [Zwartia vadi]
MFKQIGLIGLGNMGRGMALTLKRKGFAVVGTDVSLSIRETISREGISVRETIGEVIADCDIVLLSLPTAAIVEEVVCGPGGILAHAKPGLLVVDTSTSHPETTRRLAKKLNALGMQMLDAPVSGGPKGAITGTMAMVIGGDAKDLTRAEPVLAAMTAKRVHVGDIGAGHVAKIANNLFAAAHLLIAGEVTRMAAKAGVPTEQLLQGINAGSGRSFVTEHNYPTWIMNGKFDSGFTMKLMRKDVRLSQDLIAALALDLPMSAKVAELWANSAESIADDEDFNRIVELGTRN